MLLASALVVAVGYWWMLYLGRVPGSRAGARVTAALQAPELLPGGGAVRGRGVPGRRRAAARPTQAGSAGPRPRARPAVLAQPAGPTDRTPGAPAGWACPSSTPSSSPCSRQRPGRSGARSPLFGLADPRAIERQLKLVAPRSSLVEYYGEHVLVPAALLVALVVTDRALVELGFAQGGLWPSWLYVGLGVLGFLAPDLILRQRLQQRRRQDRGRAAQGAGAARHRGPARAAPCSRRWWTSRRSCAGPLGAELGQVQRELRLGHTTVVEALEEVAARNEVPELTRVVEGLVSVHSASLPAAPALEQMVTALRHERLQQIVETGGRAMEKMTLPLIVCVLLPLFALIVLPVGAMLFGPR